MFYDKRNSYHHEVRDKNHGCERHEFFSTVGEHGEDANHCDSEQESDGHHDEMKFHKAVWMVFQHKPSALVVTHRQHGEDKHSEKSRYTRHVSGSSVTSPPHKGSHCFSAPRRTLH